MVASCRYHRRQEPPPTEDTRPIHYRKSRYLDYCTEMPSLTGKIAALYVQNFDDDVALAAANDIEILTTSLSRKIWQKIMILQARQSGD